jgi:hypothetical protein
LCFPLIKRGAELHGPFKDSIKKYTKMQLAVVDHLAAIVVFLDYPRGNLGLNRMNPNVFSR